MSTMGKAALIVLGLLALLVVGALVAVSVAWDQVILRPPGAG